MNCLSKFSPLTAKVCEPLQRMMLMKSEWTYVSGVDLGVSLLQVTDGKLFSKDEAPDSMALCPITFTSKTLRSAETWYGNET